MDKSVNNVSDRVTDQDRIEDSPTEVHLTASDSSSVTPDIDRLIFAQVIDFVYRNQFSIITTILLMQIAILVSMWPSANHTILISWSLVGLCVVIWRFLMVWSYLKKKRDIDSPQRWAHYHAANSLASGIIWGSATFLFFVPGSVTNQVFLIAISISLTIGSLVVNSYYLPSFFMVATPALFATITRLFMEPDIEYQGMALLLLFYFVLVVKIAINTNKTMVDAFRLRFENLDLIQQLRKQKDAAEEANHAKSKFLAAASHDLRQPLHALSLFTALLDAGNSRQKQQDLIGKINRSQTALSSLLNTLLDISKLDAGIVEVNLCDFELDDLLEQLIPEFESEGREKNLYLHYKPSHLVVRSDPVLLEIILRNILSNAIHYTNEGGITVQADKSQTQPSQIRIEVADTGIGIPRAKQQEIFREFHQLTNPERDRTKGLGLGLAIVRRVSQLMQHDINLVSSTEQGSSFFIGLPEGNPAQVLKSRVEDVSVSQYDFPETVVMFIDDEEEIREGMQQTLNDWGCIAMVATSGDDAVSQIQTRGISPNVILTDYRLRDGERGTDAIHRVYEEIGDKIPALIITGDTAPERLREARDSGYMLLHKPLQPAQIRSFIRNAVYPPRET